MRIGIPKEILSEEKRVAATPETVMKYIELGFEVSVEASAGEGISISDEEYRMAGATVIADTVRLFKESDVVLKVKQPVFNQKLDTHEVNLLRDDGILITFLHPATPENHDIVKRLRDKNITALTMDGIPRISRAQRMDALSSMSTVTGYKSVIMAANKLPTFIPMIGTAIGTIKPATFLIVGTGVVGLQAIATAKRLGGVVKAVDIRKDACIEAESLGAKVMDFDIPQELAIGKGGYAKALEKEWLEIEQRTIAPHLEGADVVILSALVPGEVAPILVTEDMASRMKPGSVIMDVSVDQGGNCEITEPGQFIRRLGVHISGIQNIPGRMAVHASWLYANNMFHYVDNLFKNRVGTLDLEDEIVNSSLVTHHGTIYHQGTLKAMRANLSN
ncbi:NAD(P) transhydrogenase subunit alpha part 1 [Desulfosarcina widdelii]|uniref:proton-translocating NAD(P)(+) transhydrogenase n=1 Tax=Desulfosarcina widdelii TaxID=947919 RepID=A0A5K7Z5L2_9BACT|nr:NAD(P) transhydrogenase subunit alpha [Desulfosarcina widdelii]BBO75995.1 NAD(P) transhydrogenase subunit alpha part 1 [Desulfosarcina widdelii]